MPSSPKKQSPAKPGTNLVGKTVPKPPHPSISHNDSFESVGTSVAAASGSQMPLQQTNSHSMINCKHLPNRQTFLRLYYDVIRNISTMSSVSKRLCHFISLFRMGRYARCVGPVVHPYSPVSNVFIFPAATKAQTTTPTTTTTPATPSPLNAPQASSVASSAKYSSGTMIWRKYMIVRRGPLFLGS